MTSLIISPTFAWDKVCISFLGRGTGLVHKIGDGLHHLSMAKEVKIAYLLLAMAVLGPPDGVSKF
jgi:hypothetical protein